MREPSPESFLPLTDLAFNILLVLTDETLHGYALLQRLRSLAGRERLRTGTVYAALARLQDDGLVAEDDPPAEEETSDSRRRYYRSSDLGATVAGAEARRLRTLLELASEKDLLRGGIPS